MTDPAVVHAARTDVALDAAELSVLEETIGSPNSEGARPDQEGRSVTSYVILIDPTPDGGFGAWAPECIAEMREAVDFHLAGLRAEGQPIPTATTRAAFVDAA